MRKIPNILLATLIAAVLLPAYLLKAEAPPEVRLEVIRTAPLERTADPSRVHLLEDLQEIPNTYWAHGTYGDVILRNDLAALVFGAIPGEGEPPNQMRQGSILDIFTSPSAPENFHLVQPTTRHDGQGRTVLATAIDYWEDEEEGVAYVAVFGEDMNLDGLDVDTTYKMRRSWPGARATTTVTNNSSEEMTLPVLGDYVGWGAMGVFMAGSGWANRAGLLTDAEFVFGRLYDSHIMFAPLEGLMDVQHQVRHSILVYDRDVTLAPGESVEYERWILTAQRDPGRLFSFVNERKDREKRGIMAGRVQERVKLDDGRMQDAGVVPNSEVRISVIRRPDLPREYVNRPYIYTMTDDNGNFQITLPPGEYTASPAHPARLFSPSSTAIRIRGGEVTAVDHGVSAANTFVFEVVDAETGKPMPAKLTFEPLRDTPEPDLGPPGSLRSYNVVYSRTGSGLVELAPGNYRVIASHGNEYHMEERRVRVQSVRAEKTRFEMRRAFEPEGWIPADIAVMTEASPHSRITPEDRVVTALAEGLKWIVTADANQVTDLQPVVERMGFAERLLASPGFRLTSTVHRNTGEYVFFPLELCDNPSGLDFDGVKEASTPAEAMERLRAVCADAVLTAGRPVFPQVGMLTLQGYDYRTGVFPEGEIIADVDAFQIWEGKRQAVIPQSLDAYYSLLALGHRVAPVAYSLSAGTFNEEPGYPRLYVPSETRDPHDLNPAQLAASIKEGRAMITNGPFIHLSVNGEPMGSTVTAENGYVEVELAVYTPNWANVSDITVNLNGQFVRKFIIPAGAVDKERGRVYPTSDDREVERFRLSVREDSVLTVVVEGDPALPQDPVNPFMLLTEDLQPARGQRTFAISAPVMIDADGSGTVDLRLPDPAEEAPEEYVPPF